MSQEEQKTQELSQDQVQKVLDTSVEVKTSFLVQVEKIISACSERGAFKAPELQGVGSVYNMVTTAIEKVKKTVAETPVEDKPLEAVKEEQS